MIIPHDYHMHSNFSADCEYPMADMCRAAIEKGIPEIGFSEHHDLIPYEAAWNWFKPTPWWDELERCRATFAGQLKILAGIEIGEPHLYQRETQTMLASLPFDYCLGSLHWVGNETIFDRRYFSTRTPDQAFEGFFHELEVMTRIGGFDILSHFDVPLRVGFDVYGSYDPTPYQESIRPVLRNCIDRGIALDLNTASMRRAANQLTPGETILRWYTEMGGERITLGSDAHRPMHVGFGLEQAQEIALRAGLKYVTHYECRQPKMKRIQ